MLEHWDNMKEIKKPLPGRMARTILHQNYVPRVEVASLQIFFLRKTHLSRKIQLRRDHFKGNAFPQPLLFVKKKKKRNIF